MMGERVFRKILEGETYLLTADNIEAETCSRRKSRKLFWTLKKVQYKETIEKMNRERKSLPRGKLSPKKAPPLPTLAGEHLCEAQTL